jgi:hypothetical protein
MPSTIFDTTLDEPTLVIVPWHDDVVDPIGYDPRSPYVELFWLNVLGPTATWLLRRVVDGLDHYPGGYELDLEQTAKALGLGYTRGTMSPFARALQRCVLFGAAQPVDGGLAVRRRLPPVSARHLARMPDHLRSVHRSWLRTATSNEAETSRARTLAAAMVSVGDARDSIERQLLGLGAPPNVAADVAVEVAMGLAGADSTPLPAAS